jgi:hypothetical protein
LRNPHCFVRAEHVREAPVFKKVVALHKFYLKIFR